MSVAPASWKDRLAREGLWLRVAWFLVPALLWFLSFFRHRYNNYRIFKYVFWNAREGTNLYLRDPSRYADLNHYGPVFAAVIAPFAVLPDVLGGLLWLLAMVALFTWAVARLYPSPATRNLVLLLCALELWDSIWSHQFNPAVAALVMLTFADVEDGKDFRAPLWALLGAFVKLYSVVGLVFFLFSRNRRAFLAGCVVWTLFLFALPMAISSPSHVVQSYVDWFESLRGKHAENVVLGTSQDISLMGLVRRAVGVQIPTGWFFLVGLPLLLAPLARLGQYRHRRFRVLVLASLLLFVVLFSSGSENSTYVVAAAGAALWLVEQERVFSRRNVVLMVVLVLTALAPTDLLTRPVRELVLEYAGMALPYAVIWLLLCRDLLTVDFGASPAPAAANAA